LLPRIPTWVHEIIIVDGRSTYGTPDIARSIRDDVKIVLQPKKGKGIALRTGFEAASGDMIVMLDVFRFVQGWNDD
ncbi:glycosyltransferase, partial [Rhizobium ruizarguesonis]